MGGGWGDGFWSVRWKGGGGEGEAILIQKSDRCHTLSDKKLLDFTQSYQFG